MSPKTNFKVATLLSGAGVAFAGYLSFIRMTSGLCAFDEPCPFFAGHPACYTGFALFAIALVVSLAALLAKLESTWPMVINSVVAFGGTLFAARLTLVETAGHSGYRLGLPTCAYGLVFFVALLVWSLAGCVSRWRLHRVARS